MVGMSALVMFMLGYMVLIGYGILSGLPFLLLIVGLLFVLLWFARAINKEDPWMVDIYIRHVQRYKKYYPAHSDLGVDHPAVRDY